MCAARHGATPNAAYEWEAKHTPPDREAPGHHAGRDDLPPINLVGSIFIKMTHRVIEVTQTHIIIHTHTHITPGGYLTAAV